MASGHISYRDGKRGRSWYFTIPGPPGAGGKRKQIQRRGFKTRKAAESARTELLAAIQSGSYLEASNQTVEDFLNLWLQRIERDLAPNSYGRYERAVRVHLIPSLGSHPIQRLTALHIEQAHTAALKEGLSSNQVLYAYGRLKSALKRAVKWELIPRNPCDNVTPPRTSRDLEPEDRRVRALTPDEVRKLLAELACWSRMAAVIALGTGLRRGEVLGLRWQDLDFESGVLRVRQTVAPAAACGGGLIIGPPKTKKSRRDLRIPVELVDELLRYRAAQAQQRLLLGSAWQDHGLVICRSNGGYHTPSSLTGRIRAARATVGLPGVRFHDLRHTHATNLLRAGVDVTTVSQRLGHANVTMTLNTYSHVLPDMQQAASDRAGEALSRVLAG